MTGLAAYILVSGVKALTHLSVSGRKWCALKNQEKKNSISRFYFKNYINDKKIKSGCCESVVI